MRRLLTIIFTLLLVFTLAFSFGGCSKNKNREVDNDLSVDFSDGNEDSALIEQYIAVVTKREDFKNVLESTKASGMDLKLEAKGNNLVYVYTYNISVEDNATELLEQSLEASDASFKLSADSIRKENPDIDKVIWSYYDMDGNLLAYIKK